MVVGSPRKTLVPLNFTIETYATHWELTLPEAIERVSIEELSAAMSSVNKQLAKLANSGDALPSFLMLRLVCTEPDDIDMPMQATRQTPFD